MTGSGLRRAFLFVAGALNLLLAAGLLLFTDRDVLLAQPIVGAAMLLLALRPRSAPGPVRPLPYRLVPLLAASLAIAFIGVDELLGSGDDSNAPPIDESTYTHIGAGEGGTDIGLARSREAVSWRVDSAGTDNCRPAGNEALWNFVSGTARLDPSGRFHVVDSYFSHDLGYEKEVSFRLRGRFVGSAARGTFWRWDRFFDEDGFRFTCTRTGRWTAYD